LIYGLTATFNIFNGFNTSRAVKNSKIQVLMTQAELDIQQQSMRTDLYTSFADYTANAQLANLEAENLSIAQQNVEVALESYRLGGISDFELRETQLKLMDAESRLLMAQFSAKAAEVELFRLTGSLGK
jgi:outer membrane protein